MTQPTDDDTFVAFLKTYQPPAPPASATLEHRLMAEISRHPRHKNNKLTLFALGSAILAGLAVGGTILQRNTPSPQMVTSVEDVETFLVEGWEATLGHPQEISSGRPVGEDWLLQGYYGDESLNVQDY